MENNIETEMNKAERVVKYAAAVMWLMDHPEAVKDEMIKGFIEIIKDRIMQKQKEEDAAKVKK